MECTLNLIGSITNLKLYRLAYQPPGCQVARQANKPASQVPPVDPNIQHCNSYSQFASSALNPSRIGHVIPDRLAPTLPGMATDCPYDSTSDPAMSLALPCPAPSLLQAVRSVLRNTCQLLGWLACSLSTCRVPCVRDNDKELGSRSEGRGLSGRRTPADRLALPCRLTDDR